MCIVRSKLFCDLSAFWVGSEIVPVFFILDVQLLCAYLLNERFGEVVTFKCFYTWMEMKNLWHISEQAMVHLQSPLRSIKSTRGEPAEGIFLCLLVYMSVCVKSLDQTKYDTNLKFDSHTLLDHKRFLLLFLKISDPGGCKPQIIPCHLYPYSYWLKPVGVNPRPSWIKGGPPLNIG